MQFLLQQRFDNTSAGGGFRIVSSIDASALNSKSLVHDGAATSNMLQVGNGTATGRLTDGGGHVSQGSGGSFLQEWAHALGLA